MIAEKRTDFLVVDVRPSPADYKEGHIPGSIFIAPQDMFKPETLARLPKNKKIILVCGTGQVQNIPVLGLRALGYDAHTMRFGYTFSCLRILGRRSCTLAGLDICRHKDYCATCPSAFHRIPGRRPIT